MRKLGVFAAIVLCFGLISCLKATDNGSGMASLTIQTPDKIKNDVNKFELVTEYKGGESSKKQTCQVATVSQTGNSGEAATVELDTTCFPYNFTLKFWKNGGGSFNDDVWYKGSRLVGSEEVKNLMDSSNNLNIEIDLTLGDKFKGSGDNPNVTARSTTVATTKVTGKIAETTSSILVDDCNDLYLTSEIVYPAYDCPTTWQKRTCTETNPNAYSSYESKCRAISNKKLISGGRVAIIVNGSTVVQCGNHKTYSCGN